MGRQAAEFQQAEAIRAEAWRGIPVFTGSVNYLRILQHGDARLQPFSLHSLEVLKCSALLGKGGGEPGLQAALRMQDVTYSVVDPLPGSLESVSIDADDSQDCRRRL